MFFTDVDSWLREIAEYLQAGGVGTIGSSLFIERLPDAPIAATALYATGGTHAAHGSDPLHRPTLQILVRRETERAAMQAAKFIFSLLDDKWNVTPSFPGRCTADHLPGPSFLSEAGFPVFSLNFTWVVKTR